MASSAATISSSAPAPVKATPLSMRYVIPLVIVLLTEGLSSTMLLPFVGLLVAHLRGIPVEDAGYSSGILIGLFMLGQVVSGKIWGNVSDTYGRKLPLSTGLLAGAITITLFGMSPNIYVCYLLRFIHGIMNGNSLISKSIIADITDKTNEAKGFALVSITWCLGSLFGPAIGGFLYDPAINSKTQWMHVSEGSFLSRHPAFLPSLIVGIYILCAFFCCVFFLPETNRNRKPLSSIPLVGRFLSCVSDKVDAVSCAPKPAASTDVVIVDMDAPEEDPAHLHDKAEKTDKGGVVVAPAAATTTAAPVLPHRRKLSYAQAFRIAPIRNVSIFYMLICVSDMCFSEVFPLWGVAPVASGGLGVFSDGVAILNLSQSVPAVLANIGFSRMCDFMKSFLSFWRLAALITIVTSAVTPIGSELASGGYAYVLIVGIIRQVGMSWNYSLVYLLTAKSAPPGCVGSVYGISQSCASVSRCIVPFIATPLFAWSLKDGHVFPFNHYLLFFLAVIPVIASYFLTYSWQLLPAEDDEMYAPVSAEHGDHDGTTTTNGADGAPAGDGNDDDDDAQSGRASSYISLVASFATNPISEAYLDVNKMEEENARERAQRQGRGDPTAAPTRMPPVTDPIAAWLPRKEEDTRVPVDDNETAV